MSIFEIIKELFKQFALTSQQLSTHNLDLIIYENGKIVRNSAYFYDFDKLPIYQIFEFFFNHIFCNTYVIRIFFLIVIIYFTLKTFRMFLLILFIFYILFKKIYIYIFFYEKKKHIKLIEKTEKSYVKFYKYYNRVLSKNLILSFYSKIKSLLKFEELLKKKDNKDNDNKLKSFLSQVKENFIIRKKYIYKLSPTYDKRKEIFFEYFEEKDLVIDALKNNNIIFETNWDEILINLPFIDKVSLDLVSNAFTFTDIKYNISLYKNRDRKYFISKKNRKSVEKWIKTLNKNDFMIRDLHYSNKFLFIKYGWNDIKDFDWFFKYDVNSKVTNLSYFHQQKVSGLFIKDRNYFTRDWLRLKTGVLNLPLKFIYKKKKNNFFEWLKLQFSQFINWEDFIFFRLSKLIRCLA